MDVLSYLLGKNAGGAKGLKVEVVETLPQTGESNVLYLVPKQTAETSNVFDEYLYINNAWEKIGTTDIDLSGYVTDEELLQALATKQNTLTAGDNITIENNVISASGGNIYYCTYGDTTSEEIIAMSQEIIDKAFNNEEMILIVKVNNDKTYISSSYEFQNYPSSKFVRFSFSDSGYEVMSGSQSVSMPLTGFTVAITFDENRDFVRINYNPVASYNLARRYDSNNSYGVLGAKNTTAYTPTAGSYNPATAKYAEDTASATVVSDKLTGTTAPTTATVGYVGQQYTDTTSNNQYVCTAVDTETPEYTWVQVNGGGSSNNKIYFKLIGSKTNRLTFGGSYYPTGSGIVLEIANAITEALQAGAEFLVLEFYESNTSNNAHGLFISSANIQTTYSDTDIHTMQFMCINSTKISGTNDYYPLISSAHIGLNGKYSNNNFVIDFFWAFSPISNSPFDSTYQKFIPTNLNKSTSGINYVEDVPKSYSGYDATKTQVLKNVQGVLQWVDEA